MNWNAFEQLLIKPDSLCFWEYFYMPKHLIEEEMVDDFLASQQNKLSNDTLKDAIVTLD